MPKEVINKTHKNCIQALLFSASLMPIVSTATFPNLDSMLEALRPIAATTAPELDILINGLDALAPEQKQDALQTLVPFADGSLTALSNVAMRQMLSSIEERVIYIENEDECNSNQPCRDPKPTKGAWGQILGATVDQEDRQQVAGYNGYTLGGIIGKDWLICPQVLMGVAAGYQYADLDSNGPSGSNQAIKRYNGTWYGRYTASHKPFYAQAVFTFARQYYETHRHILVPPVGGTPIVYIANGDFVAWETNAHVETGIPYRCRCLTVTPKVMMTFSHLDPEGYIERDAYGYNLNVKYQDMNALLLGAGGKIHYQNQFKHVYVNPEIHGYAFYDFIQDKQIASATFLGGGYTFLTQGFEVPSSFYEVGAGVSVHSDKHTLVKIQYDYMKQTDFHRHQAYVKIRHEWT